MQFRTASALIFSAFLAVMSLTFFATSAQADPGRCIANWPWKSDRHSQWDHKALHLAGSAAVTMAVARATDSVEWGIAAGITAGAVRELYKYRQPGMRCEYSSMAFDAAGVLLGAEVSRRWLIVPQRGGVQVAFSTAW